MKKNTLKHQAYDIIKANILNCTFAPNALINEEILQEHVSASRTPIRDALSRLEQEGLVTILPKKGILVSGFSLKELNMVYDTRFLLESYAIRQFGQMIPDSVYLEFFDRHNAYKNGLSDTYSYEEMDSRLHHSFIQATENTYLINTYATIESQVARMRYLTGSSSTDRLEATVSEHLAVITAALKHDWDGAAQAMVHHLTQSKAIFFDYMLNSQNKQNDQ